VLGSSRGAPVSSPLERPRTVAFGEGVPIDASPSDDRSEQQQQQQQQARHPHPTGEAGAPC